MPDSLLFINFVPVFIDELRDYCLSKPYTEEGFPFDNDTLVFKVDGKMFALISVSEPDTVNLKCDPDYALELRASHPEVQPGYHMNKKMWNTVALQEGLDDDFLRALIDHSYLEVVNTFTRKRKRELGIG